MAQKPLMLRFAKWHIWLGWLVGFPILMWMVTGLFMASKPIEEVRGNHLRIEAEPQALPPGNPVPIPIQLSDAPPIREFRTAMQRGRAVTFVTYLDGRVKRFDATEGTSINALDALEAREVAEQAIVGGQEVERVTFFDAKETPFDFRREIPVWQVALKDGARVYVGRDTGEIEAVRTRWWRWFDFMWGLHIMDLQTREKTSHPILIIFALLGVIGALLGCILMFRRRKARIAG
ncbi:PepSY domain-containing protein [Altererythrobacter arenosus]|uniref:PepSY domain-containing protein n=1 Tax=Altererythrobacter arenosus TaxID=3032592 RepID=A0ABY8FP89_9SPHN|nr:PepSY domain-containing protein [Altererythrobacter sp. CAU 1644]WFL76682.1 PepSY domain-containing protein [Altererythrobacter sp. CAU 1644]